MAASSIDGTGRHGSRTLGDHWFDPSIAHGAETRVATRVSWLERLPTNRRRRPLRGGASPKIIPKIAELGQADLRPKLASSLNASNEEQRQALMPITRKYHLKDLMEACRAYPLRPWEKLTFEYVLLKGVNDTDGDARRVVQLVARLNAKVNLIALNPGPGIPFETPNPARVASFQAIIRRSLPCFVRKPRGLDVYAACGQLKRMETGGLTQIQ